MSPPLIHRPWRRELPHYCAVFLLLLALYGYTTPHTVTLEDDAFFIANFKFFGVAHPPGYPIHTFLGGIFYHLIPFGTPAFKGHLFSGFFGALAAVSVYAVTIVLVRQRACAYLAALACGVGKTFWSQAIITEVYTLNAFFFFTALALCIRYTAHCSPDDKSDAAHRRLLYGIAFICGLALANHHPLFLLTGVGLAVLLWQQRKNIFAPLTFIKALIVFLFAVVPPYLWMVWRSFSDTLANFYGPIAGWEAFWFYITRQGYSTIDKQEGVDWADKLTFLHNFADELLWQFTPLALLFAVIGVIALWRSPQRHLCAALAISWFAAGIALIFILDFPSDDFWLSVFEVYLLPVYGITALWLGIGADALINKIKNERNGEATRRAVAAGTAAVIVIGSVALHWNINNRRDYTWAHDLATAQLNSLEENAVLFVHDDLDAPLSYLRYVENHRPDITIYSDKGVFLGNRLFPPFMLTFPPADNPGAPNKMRILHNFIAATDRPIYYNPAHDEIFLTPQHGYDFLGFFKRVNRTQPGEHAQLSDEMRQWLQNNVAVGKDITDSWTQFQHREVIKRLMVAVIVAHGHGFVLDEQWQAALAQVRTDEPTAYMVYAAYLGSRADTDEAVLRDNLTWAESFDIAGDNHLSDYQRALFFLMRADLYRRLHSEADPRYEESLRLGAQEYYAADNVTWQPLLRFYFEQQRYCDFLALATYAYAESGTPPSLLAAVHTAKQNSNNCPPTHKEFG